MYVYECILYECLSALAVRRGDERAVTYIYHYMYINNDVTLYKFCIIYGIVANTLISPVPRELRLGQNYDSLCFVQIEDRESLVGICS